MTEPTAAHYNTAKSATLRHCPPALYQQDPESWDDLANFALAHALRTYDPAKGTAVSTWITLIVKQKIHTACLQMRKRRAKLRQLYLPEETDDGMCEVHRRDDVLWAPEPEERWAAELLAALPLSDRQREVADRVILGGEPQCKLTEEWNVSRQAVSDTYTTVLTKFARRYETIFGVGGA